MIHHFKNDFDYYCCLDLIQIKKNSKYLLIKNITQKQYLHQSLYNPIAFLISLQSNRLLEQKVKQFNLKIVTHVCSKKENQI